MGERRMRIIAGKHKGRPIVAPKGDTTRPTTDRVREAIFSRLVSDFGDFSDISVLDSFAGSGALGLEALSRGAKRAVFVEEHAKTAQIVKKNIDTLSFGQNSNLLVVDAFKSTTAIAVYGPFDIIFLDPPYKVVPEAIFSYLCDLANRGAINANATIVYEHSAAAKFDLPVGFVISAQKKYGSTVISYADFKGNE
ncbi:MAG: 16S rRNA (guanine(966)-N(2))-methyltransferase RsmD [Coriobacteriia bacterium]|nr:16S rRNA (guanine(966)-N(2))-methyltransferase RsmD [Coriobacteriia bacterium]